MRKFILFSSATSLLILITSQAHRLAAEPDSALPAASKSPSAGPSEEGKLIVHEWGTFTTFSGSDGVFMEFRPLVAEHSDLPPYVLDRGSFARGGFLSKKRLWGRVRMETPVTYFYADRVRTIDVRVEFPKGLLTEFYPPVNEVLPPIDQKNIYGKGELIGNSSLNWGKVDLIPIDQLVPGVPDQVVRDRLTRDMLTRLLPSGPNEQHYAQARQTDSALVHVHGRAGLDSPEKGFFEKFLFYRGVGKFQLPIIAEYDSSGITLRNDAGLPLHSAILIETDGGYTKAAQLDRIEPGESLAFAAPVHVNEQQLVDMVQQVLVDEGLYEKEASSMVKTWQKSWFSENGTRILYIVPESITEELIPLHVTPEPNETLRVLVGRMELMSPDAEQNLINAVTRSAKDRREHRAGQNDESKRVPYAIPPYIREFGRMTEPALVRVGNISSDEVRAEAKLLISEFRK